MVDSLAQAEAFDWLPLTGFHLLFNIFSCLSVLIFRGRLIVNHS